VAMIQKRAVNMAAVRKHIEVSDIRMKDTSVAGTSTYARFDAVYDAGLCGESAASPCLIHECEAGNVND
jgi:hypothetical protein